MDNIAKCPHPHYYLHIKIVFFLHISSQQKLSIIVHRTHIDFLLVMIHQSAYD